MSHASDSQFAYAVGWEGMLDIVADDLIEDVLPAEDLAAHTSNAGTDNFFSKSCGADQAPNEFEWNESLLPLPTPEELKELEDAAAAYRAEHLAVEAAEVEAAEAERAEFEGGAAQEN